jgi:hypothetical protein
MKRMVATACLAASLLIAVGCGKEDKDKANAGREMTALREEVAALKQENEELREHIALLRGRPARNTKGISGTSRSGPKPDDAAKKPAVFHLRVASFAASVEGKRSAEDVVAFLAQHGVRDAHARLSVGETKHWVVDIGSFESATDKAALELKNKVAGLQRSGYRFPGAYFVAY